MEKARIVFSGVTTAAEVTKLQSFRVTQNNRQQVVHVADYVSRGSHRQMTFLNGVEATLLGAKYVKAQSKVELCARLEFISDEAAV
jgi:hypothetical protein